MSEISGSTFDESIYFEQTGAYPYVPESISAASQVMPDFREDKPKENPSTELIKQLLKMQFSDRSWLLDARCRVDESESFFVSRNGNKEPAKSICNKCISKEDCLEFALATNEPFGIWGGMTRAERIRIKNKQKI